MRKHHVDDAPVALVNGERHFGRILFGYIVIGAEFEEHQVVDLRLEHVQMEPFLL